jgi:hypothetical protein
MELKNRQSSPLQIESYAMDSFVSTTDMSSLFAPSELDVHDDGSTPATDVLVNSQYNPTGSNGFSTYCIIA